MKYKPINFIMKNNFVLAGLLLSAFCSAQNIKATTEDGKKVILKADKTWEYEKIEGGQSCDIPAKFKEPEGDKKNKKFLEMTDATVADMKKHVSIDLGVEESKIILLELSEQKGNAIYVLCINGIKHKYRRTGSVFFRDGSEPYKP